ncbi:hypothetical protein DXG01_008203 [Tephrocybe rancida]|nr:hypothetical protein DXG01_008203 [Tephrocybe rancida]
MVAKQAMTADTANGNQRAKSLTPAEGSSDEQGDADWLTSRISSLSLSSSQSRTQPITPIRTPKNSTLLKDSLSSTTSSPTASQRKSPYCGGKNKDGSPCGNKSRMGCRWHRRPSLETPDRPVLGRLGATLTDTSVESDGDESDDEHAAPLSTDLPKNPKLTTIRIKKILHKTEFRSSKTGKMAKFSEWISYNLKSETQALLHLEMEKPLSPSDEEGYIYAIQILDPNTQGTVKFKVGRTNDVNIRYNYWLERLIQLELRGTSLEVERKSSLDCEEEHMEIFEFKKLTGKKKNQEYELLVKPVIDNWGRFVAKHFDGVEEDVDSEANLTVEVTLRATVKKDIGL